jgi:GTP-binding protein
VAIVEDFPGTTRDRLHGTFDWRGRIASVVDTGGIVPGVSEDVTESVFEQIQIAIEEADTIVFVLDSRTGVTPVDEDIADMLRRTSKPLILAVNKVDNVKQESSALEFHALGLGDPIPVSAERGLGVGDLLDAIVDTLPPAIEEEAETDSVRVAIVGRPNVGKSSLVNALVGKKRTVVSPTPGTTRDAIDTEIELDEQRVILVDTAGIRRRGKVEQGIERYSVIRALRAVERCDVAVLLVDATVPVAAQDAHLAGFVHEEAKGLVVAVNKWDLIPKESNTMGQYERMLREAYKFMPYIPIVFISAKTGQRIQNVLQLALQIRAERMKRVPTGPLNDAVQRALHEHQAPSHRGRLLKLLYITQVGVDPPTFVVKVNEPDLAHFGFKRYLENRLRDRFGFFGTPIRLYFRARGRSERAS